MDVVLINIIGFCFLVGAGGFIGIVGHLVIKDFPLMQRDPNYMSFFFSQRKTHARLLITLGLLDVVLFITVFALIGIRGRHL
ncbi:hypothetical protein [Pararhizobium sp. A13]|uniref:hypothetical protein n=1 Tax=Pararhizobium sp. A13 TaxID=3133975 RepID=UPI003249077C